MRHKKPSPRVHSNETNQVNTDETFVGESYQVLCASGNIHLASFPLWLCLCAVWCKIVDNTAHRDYGEGRRSARCPPGTRRRLQKALAKLEAIRKCYTCIPLREIVPVCEARIRLIG